ncbi:MAG: asparagine synthase-related protein [Oscillospiraceae bacterium]|nr:asparagine synthase-related protein [Oscillospiraceae bacterium]MCL2279533.1 asparagine synthase-related protein [Oscillospiraceae bacterium]
MASDMLYIAEYFKHNNIPTTLNISGAYSLLTISSMIEDATLFSEVKRLLPGHYLLISCNKYEVKRYYKLKFEYNCNLPEKEIIDKLDRLFADAVKLGLEKDREYGYKHSVALSAGLDSRMTTFVANKLGYGHSILNNTFSQTDYLDETIPKKIASELRHKWLFKSLDNGLFLLDIDKTIKVTSGMVSCNGSAHALDYFETFNFDNYGLQHSGQLGDVIVGSYIRKFSQLSQDYSFSSILKSKLIDTKGIPPVDLQLSYDNAEDFLFFHRGYMCVNQGLVALQYFTETVSPFLDIEFLEYCMSIHPEIRMHHKLYYKWINAKHPAVAKYTHEMLGAKINARKITLFGFTVPIKRLPIAAIQFFLIKLNIIKNNAGNSKKSMNPFGYWYNTNEDFRAAIHSYYNSYSGKLHQYPDLAKDCEAVFLNGTVAEKFRVLTLIGMLKMYF